MRLTFTREQEAFREEVRDFLRIEMPYPPSLEYPGGLCEGNSREFSHKMAEKGWIGLTWPKPYGGQERTYVEKAILMEELLKVNAPIQYHLLADRQVGPAIIRFGSEWQKAFFLPRIVRAEEGAMFCLLFSEPNAGSDLASVSTTAVRDGDHYLINGQKVWTTAGHLSDYGWMLAKTNLDKSVRKHLTLSEFIVDMKAPGISLKPIINMVGAHSFNEVFFDDVKIHKRFLVGQENAGFKQIMAQMDYERAGIERLLQNYSIYEQLITYFKQMDKTTGFYAWARDAMAQLEIERSVGRLLCYYIAWIIDQGRSPSAEAAMCKAFCTLYEQRLTDFATRVLGPISQVRAGVEGLPLKGELATAYLWSPSYTLQGGSVAILKNIVALRGLDLPVK